MRIVNQCDLDFINSECSRYRAKIEAEDKEHVLMLRPPLCEEMRQVPNIVIDHLIELITYWVKVRGF